MSGLELTDGFELIVTQCTEPYAQHYLLYYNNSLERLEFVTCGQRGISALRFPELVDIFSCEIWLTIFLLGIVVASFHSLLIMKQKIKPISGFIKQVIVNLESIIKVYLERGDQYNDFQLKYQATRSTTSGFLLAALVISNAYRSTNVCNIVMPRYYLQYHTIAQLKERNCTVYAMLEAFDFNLYGFKEPLELFIKDRHSIEGKDNRNAYVMGLSVVKTLADDLQNTSWLVDADRKMIRLSILMPDSMKIINQVLKEVNPALLYQSVEESDKYIETIDNSVYKQGEQKLIEKLSECNNVAVVIPHHLNK